MMAARKYLACCLAIASAFMYGCATSETVTRGGYTWHVAISHLPDAGATQFITHKGLNEAERRLWPKLMSGEYGHYLVHDDLIIFQANRPRFLDGGYEPDSGIFAAAAGPPAVEITKRILETAARQGIENTNVFIRDTTFETSGSGVRVSLLCWVGYAEPDKSSLERREFGLTWQEIGSVVESLRTTGVKHTFRGVDYYAE